MGLSASSAHDLGNDRVKDDDRRSCGIDLDREPVTIIVQQRLGFPPVGIEPLANDLLICVVKTIVPDRPLLQSFDELAPIRTAQVKDLLHIE